MRETTAAVRAIERALVGIGSREIAPLDATCFVCEKPPVRSTFALAEVGAPRILSVSRYVACPSEKITPLVSVASSEKINLTHDAWASRRGHGRVSGLIRVSNTKPWLLHCLLLPRRRLVRPPQVVVHQVRNRTTFIPPVRSRARRKPVHKSGARGRVPLTPPPVTARSSFSVPSNKAPTQML